MATSDVSVPNDKPKALITIQVDKAGNLLVNAVNQDDQPLTFKEQRELLHRVLDLVNDNLMAVFVQAYLDRVMAAKVQANGFRPTKILDFLGRK